MVRVHWGSGYCVCTVTVRMLQEGKSCRIIDIFFSFKKVSDSDLDFLSNADLSGFVLYCRLCVSFFLILWRTWNPTLTQLHLWFRLMPLVCGLRLASPPRWVAAQCGPQAALGHGETVGVGTEHCHHPSQVSLNLVEPAVLENIYERSTIVGTFTVGAHTVYVCTHFIFYLKELYRRSYCKRYV